MKLGHFKVYRVRDRSQKALDCEVFGQFDDPGAWRQVTLARMSHMSNPTTKTDSEGHLHPIFDPDAHFIWRKYEQADEASESIQRYVDFKNQFLPGNSQNEVQRWLLNEPTHLLLPAKKDGHDMPTDLDHFEAYPVAEVVGAEASATVTLSDQFDEDSSDVVTLLAGRFFCVPVSKRVGAVTTDVLHPKAHLAAYTLLPKKNYGRIVQMEDQFTLADLKVTTRVMLCVPSLKLGWQKQNN